MFIDGNINIQGNCVDGKIVYSNFDIFFALQNPISSVKDDVDQNEESMNRLLTLFRMLGFVPSFADFFALILSHNQVPMDQIPYFSLQKCDKESNPLEAVCICNGKVKSLIDSSFGKVFVDEFGASWKYQGTTGRYVSYNYDGVNGFSYGPIFAVCSSYELDQLKTDQKGRKCIESSIEQFDPSLLSSFYEAELLVRTIEFYKTEKFALSLARKRDLLD